MKKKRCLIFGANGFIASNFSKTVKLEKNFTIINFPKNKLNLLNKNNIIKLKKNCKKR